MAVSLTALSFQAEAQPAGDPPTDQVTADSGQLQEVLVTGSIIPRRNLETPSPVQVITADELTQSGYTSVQQALNTLSANGQGTLSQGFTGGFAGGASGVALRGLTVGETLTLLDGERMVDYPIPDDDERGFVDTASIPMLAIDHIDVLKDGASAEYGSDAIAGVVNVILKKTYTGAEFSAQGGTTIHGDGTTERLTGIAGTGDLASNGYNGWIAVEWRHQDEILNAARSGAWNALNWTPYGGTNATPGAGSPYALYGAGSPFPFADAPYYAGATATSFSSPDVTYNANSACPSAAALAADKCSYFPPRDEIQPQTGNLNVLGRFTVAMGDNWQETTTASLFRSESEQVDPYPNTGGLLGVPPGSPIEYPVYGPRFATYNSTPVTLTMPNGDSPVATLSEFGQQTNQFVTSTYRAFFDFTGKEGGWDINANAGMMYALTDEHHYGYVNFAALQTALTNGYLPGSGGPLVADVAPNLQSDVSNSLQVVDVRATRNLVTLPGGPLGLGVGVGFYHSYLDNTPSPAVDSGNFPTLTLAYAYGGQTDLNSYVELDAPVVKGLEIDAAERVDHYATTGGVGVPKFGVKYSPIDQITLRGTYGQGFRAPTAAESGHSADLSFTGFGADADLCPTQATPANYSGTPGLYYAGPPGAGDVPYYCAYPAAQLQVGNPNLKAQRSTNYTYGVLFQPVPQTELSVDFWRIVISNPIIDNLEFPTLNAFLPPTNISSPRTGPVSLPVLQANGSFANMSFPEGEPLYNESTYVNAGKMSVDGVDFDLAAHLDLGAYGRFSPELHWTHQMVWNVGSCYAGACKTLHLAGTHGPSGISGDTGNPRDRAVLTLAWDRGPLNVTATVNYTGPYTNTDPSLGLDTCTQMLDEYYAYFKLANFSLPPHACAVKAFTDVNLYGDYAVSSHLLLFGSIQNLFNTPPPVDLGTYAGNTSFNPSLAQAGAVGMFFDLGIRYRL
ncbi:MAG TPA: TonB-dependent receptor [Steroidobacteraceae bacterium]|nr:TonB-dependent receptor [Steroidobacteraceae bacterium]